MTKMLKETLDAFKQIESEIWHAGYEEDTKRLKNIEKRLAKLHEILDSVKQPDRSEIG